MRKKVIGKEIKVVYEDRIDAAKELISTIPLGVFEGENVVAIAVSEGGVIIASQIAKYLKGSLEIFLCEAIKAPNNPELTIAMVGESEEIVMHDILVRSFGIDEDYIYGQASRMHDEQIISYIYKYRKGEAIQDLRGRDVILVDEGVESGMTMMVAIKTMLSMDIRSLHIATPILSLEVYDGLLELCDGIFCSHVVQDYISIEYYYRNLEKPSLAQIVKIIEEHN
jgi:putative phosphoribosyl transferase